MLWICQTTMRKRSRRNQCHPFNCAAEEVAAKRGRMLGMFVAMVTPQIEWSYRRSMPLRLA